MVAAITVVPMGVDMSSMDSMRTPTIKEGGVGEEEEEGWSLTHPLDPLIQVCVIFSEM